VLIKTGAKTVQLKANEINKNTWQPKWAKFDQIKDFLEIFIHVSTLWILVKMNYQPLSTAEGSMKVSEVHQSSKGWTHLSLNESMSYTKMNILHQIHNNSKPNNDKNLKLFKFTKTHWKIENENSLKNWSNKNYIKL
jgi:hypothetical protein